MNYQQFVSAVEIRIKQKIGRNMSVQIHTTLKNNGRERIGITISEKEINISPTIYLEEYYEEYKKNASLEDIVRNILSLYREIKYEHSWNAAELENYQSIKPKILYRLINAEKNKVFLETVPHEFYLDLAIVFYVLYDISEEGAATITITNDLLKLWNVSADTIYKQALQNTPALLPHEFKPMCDIINELLGNHASQTTSDTCMYVLTNHARSFGAACILYENVLTDIGETLGENYYVLPSSIHEAIIIPESNSPHRLDLDDMICEINETQVPPEEVLSNRAYYFSRKENRLLL